MTEFESTTTASGFKPWLHGLLLSATFAVFAYPLALPAGLVAGCFGAVVGTLAAQRLEAMRLRLWVITLMAAALGGLGLVAPDALTQSASLAAALEPTFTMRLAEVLRWFFIALGACLAVRAVALRYRAALAVEGTAAVLAAIGTVAAHRDGMIARPLEISDWFWRHGIDPVIGFLGVGLGATLLLAGVLAYGRSRLRVIAQLLVVIVIGLLVGDRIHSAEPSASQKNAVGQALQKKKDQERDKKNKSGGTSSDGQKEKQSGAQDDLPPPPKQGAGSNRPSAVVVFHRDVRPASGAFYFRHAAFSQFNGVRLVEATLPGVDSDAQNHFPLEPVEIPGVHRNGDARTEVATDVALLSDHSRLFALRDATLISPKGNPDPGRFRRAYSVVSQVLTTDFMQLVGAPAGDPSWTPQEWELYTEAPNDARYLELAKRLQAGLRDEYAEDPLATAFAIKRHLEKTSTYSFKRKYEGDDPTGAFLFSEDRVGYCVHLAHSAAYLMRSLGIPARVSAGYAVPAENLGGGSSLLIKDGDAHAWAEVYLQDIGWIPIEVTPEKTDVQPKPFQEKDLQQLLGEMARKEGRFERPADRGVDIGSWLSMIRNAVPWLLLGLLMLGYLTKFWRLVSPFVGDGRARRAYRAGLDRLSAVGIKRRHGETREAFAERVAEVSKSFSPLSAVRAAAVWGGAEASQTAREWAMAVGSEVRNHVPWWRWCLGLLNPISWMGSR